MVLPGQGNSLVEHVAHRTLSVGLCSGQLSLPHAHPTPTHKLRCGLGLAQQRPLNAHTLAWCITENLQCHVRGWGGTHARSWERNKPCFFFFLHTAVCSPSHVRASADCVAFMWEEACWLVGMLVWAQKRRGQSAGTWHKTSLDTSQIDKPKRGKNLQNNKKRLEVMRTTQSITGTQSQQRRQSRLLKGDNSVQVR